MAAGAMRIIEIAFVLRDRNTVDEKDVEEVNSFQYLTPFVSISSILVYEVADTI